MRHQKLAVVGLIAAWCVAVAYHAAHCAPAPTNVPALVGELGEELGSPVVYLPDDDAPKIYWLVFSEPAVEAQCRKLEVGNRVVVMGRVAAGGKFRYVIATSIKVDE